MIIQLNKKISTFDSSQDSIKFPAFRKLEWTDQDLIKQAICNIKLPSSTFHFTCLMLYNDPCCEISFLNDNLILKISNLSSEDEYYVLCGFNKVVETIAEIFNFQRDKALLPSLHFVPEEIVQFDSKLQERYKIIEDRDFFDYVYALKDLKNYDSLDEHHHSQRNYRHFKKHFPNAKIESLDASNKEIQIEIINEFEKWKIQRHREDERIENEFKALNRFFELADTINFQVLALKDNKNLIACEVHELVEPEFIIGHFCKILPGYVGAEEIILHKIAENYMPQGYKYLNVQEDLGIEGLRAHKLNLHPAFFIKSYAIYPKE